MGAHDERDSLNHVASDDRRARRPAPARNGGDRREHESEGARRRDESLSEMLSMFIISAVLQCGMRLNLRTLVLVLLAIALVLFILSYI